MSRSTLLLLACLVSALVLLPLAVKKPGLPMQPRAEEPTWYLMAASLARDGDLACGPDDLRRLFTAWPFATDPNLELASLDGGTPLIFARPVLYPLLAAPWVALFGANGPVALNLLLLCAAIAAGTLWLARPAGEAAALLFALGFFLVAVPFAWAFVIAPQLLTLAAVSCGLVLAWQREETGHPPATRRAAAAGALLAVAVYQEPWVAPLALVPCALWLVERKLRPALVGLGGAAAVLLVAGGFAFWTTGAIHPALGLDPRSVTIADPLGQPPLPELFSTAPASTAEPGNARLGDFLWGRHMGLLPYFPWVLPALLFFALDGRRSRRRLVLAAALALSIVLIWSLGPFAQQTGGDAIGNPLLVGLYPGFLLLVRSLRPTWATLGGYALGALLLGSLLFVPFGASVAGSSFQAHTRNRPLADLPLELGLLANLPDYQALELTEGLRVWSRRDQVETRGAELAVLGGDRVELWVEAPADLGSALLLEIESEATPNQLEIDLGGEETTVSFDSPEAAGKPRRLELRAGRQSTRRRVADTERSFYRLVVETERGARAGWRDPERNGRGSALGAKLMFLGLEEWLARDLFHAEWLGCGAPSQVQAGEEFLALARLRNTSAFAWPTRGGARVRLSYHWLDSAGGQVTYNGARTDLAAPVAPGAVLETWQKVNAPAAPGRYQLELDPLFERVAWFSARGAPTCRQPIEVVPARAEPSADTASAPPSSR